MEEEVPSTSSSSSNLQIVEVNPEEGIKIKEEDMQIKTEIEVPKKPTATIALPFSPFSAGMKPKPNQTIKIYHIPAANGIGSTKPPIIKGCKTVDSRMKGSEEMRVPWGHVHPLILWGEKTKISLEFCLFAWLT